MNACRRFEEEALERIERGLPLDSHFETCSECRREREKYRALKMALSQEPGELAPPEGWQDEVWRYVDQEESGQAEDHGRRTWIGLAVATAAAVLLGIFIFGENQQDPVETQLVVRTEKGRDVIKRNTEVQVGDAIVIQADVDSDRAAQLRIYRDAEELLVDCSDVLPCRRSGNQIEVTYTIEERGQYEVVLITFDGEIPVATGSLDADIGAAKDAGCEYKLSERITAR